MATEPGPESGSETVEVRRVLPPPPHRIYGLGLNEPEPEMPRRKARFWLPWLGCVVLSITAALVYEGWTVDRPAAPAPAPPVPSGPQATAALQPQATAIPTPVPTPAPVAVPNPTPLPTPSEAVPVEPKAVAPKHKQREKPPEPTASAGSTAVAFPPTVVHEVHPGLSPGIAARIQEPIVIPVRVTVSVTGRVLAAVPQDQGERERGSEDGLRRYLKTQATKAAMLWTFSPATTSDGTRVLADKTIYMIFTRK